MSGRQMASLKRVIAAPSAAWIGVAAATAASALFGAVAAGARWLAALGAYVTRKGSIPGFVPYASAPSQGWVIVPALGELTFHGLEVVGGDHALFVAQVLAVAVAFSLLAVDMEHGGASPVSSAW